MYTISTLWYASIKMTCICENHFRCSATLLLQMQPQVDTITAPEDPQAKLHHIFETYVCMDLPLFGRSLPLLWKKPSDSRKKPLDLWRSCAANTFQKNVLSVGVIFFDVYRMCILGKLPDDITRSQVDNELECSAVLALSHRQLKLAYGKSELQLCSCYRSDSLPLIQFLCIPKLFLEFHS